METILQIENISLWQYMFRNIFCSIVSYNCIETKSGNNPKAYQQEDDLISYSTPRL